MTSTSATPVVTQAAPELLVPGAAPELKVQGKMRKLGTLTTMTYTKCAFLTDVQGDFKYFCRYVDNSKVIEWEDKHPQKLKFKDKDTMLVFGGNSQDNRAHSFTVYHYKHIYDID